MRKNFGYWFLELKDKMWTVTPTAMQKSRMRSHSGCTSTMLTVTVTQRVLTDMTLTLREMHLCLSQAYSRGEPLSQHHAVSSRKGVVGRTGRNIPVTPSPSDTAPNMISR